MHTSSIREYSRRWHKKNMAAQLIINNNKLYNCNMAEEHTPVAGGASTLL